MHWQYCVWFITEKQEIYLFFYFNSWNLVSSLVTISADVTKDLISKTMADVMEDNGKAGF